MTTQFTETNALLLAIEDVEADSGNHDPLDAYLSENFLAAEIWHLLEAAQRLADRCEIVYRQMTNT